MNNTNDENKINRKTNFPLLIFDILLLPIHLLRIIIIYYWGSKYNLKGFQFLDVIMHSDNPYFNQEDCRVINTIGKDYRVVLRDDSRIFPMDIKNYLNIEKNNKDIIVGTIKSNRHKGNSSSMWDISTEDISNKKRKYETDTIFTDDTQSMDLTTDSDSDSDSDNDGSIDSEISNDEIKNKDIKGVNLFDNDVNIKVKKKDILHSLRSELDSVFGH
jgi:hypothetical protein